MSSTESIKEKAFDWAIDYKPWEYDLPPQDYARYGYEQGYQQALEDMPIQLKKIELTPFPANRLQRPSSQDSRISAKKTYLVKIYGQWYTGQFSKQHYGWSFNGWGNAGLQLNSIEGPLYEIIESEK